MAAKASPETTAQRAAKALDTRNPPGDDWCGFSYDVGRFLSDLSNARNGPSFEAHYLALGILDREIEREAELDEKMSAEERERRERIRELVRQVRLVTVDGKRVQL